MKDFGDLMKHAQDMQEKMANMQTELDGAIISGSSAGGMVQISLTGKGEMKNINLDKTLVNPEEVEVLEDLIIAAYNDAKKKVEDNMQEKLSKVTGGLNLPPGMTLPF